MCFRGIIFDLDGTLLNTLDDLANSMNAVLRNMGLPTHAHEKYKLFVGKGVENLVRQALPDTGMDDAHVALCVARMREEYEKRWAENTRPYDGIPELLDNLKKSGIKVAVLSNKPDEFTRVMIAHFFPGYTFEAVEGAKPSVPKKPNPASALEISRIMGIAPREILYVGDSDIDMQTANAAGMYAAGALWGFRSAEELLANGARTLLHKPLDLLKLL